MHRTGCSRRTARAAAGLCIGLVTAAGPSHGWSKYVHELICEMALQQLPDAHKRQVYFLSSGQNAAGPYRTFASSCEWADDVRRTTHLETYEYHFINVPQSEERIDFARDCAAYDCASQAIVRYAVYLADPGRDEEDRAEALRFLGHFVADLHQPLHAGFLEDRGGNDLYVALAPGERANKKLHGVWDGTIPFRLDLLAGGQGAQRVTAMREIAEGLVEEVTEAEKSAWRTTSVKSWARESHRHARRCTYRIHCDPDQRLLRSGDFLSDTYWSRAEPIVEQRIKMASVRLALLLELALDGRLEPAKLEAD